ncbi:hypothetical protein QW180_25385 [Vibrio sinaloensis]|nr:hypothetical protein [Vibrio sinaloensis]
MSSLDATTDQTNLINRKMLEAINAVSLDALIDETVPAQIRLEQPMTLAEAKKRSRHAGCHARVR